MLGSHMWECGVAAMALGHKLFHRELRVTPASVQHQVRHKSIRWNQVCHSNVGKIQSYYIQQIQKVTTCDVEGKNIMYKNQQ